jgi:glycosyltransferase involved in cell wall biosynthesis
MTGAVADSQGSGNRGADRKFRILLVSNFFPPNIKGGAELACAHLARWLAAQGHAVGVLTLAAPSAPETDEQVSEFLTIFRRQVPNVYHTFLHDRAPSWKKPLWHLIDHWNPSSARILQSVIREFAPDVINTHNLQGMGYNLWRVMGRSGRPVLVTLHDPALVCIRSSMFRNGRSCEKICAGCEVSHRLKASFLSRIECLAFVSPSRSLLKILRPYLPANTVEALALPNPLDFGKAAIAPRETGRIELLYVGQISEHKGVRFILDVLASIPEPKPFRITLLGRGPLLAVLQEKYAGANWARLEGFVPPEKVQSYMAESNLLVIPSLWIENAPLVAMEAVSMGLPLLASDRGGLPELVEHDVTGLTLPAGDAPAWRDAIEKIVADRTVLEKWTTNAVARGTEFDVNALGARYLDLVERLLNRR